MLVEARLRGAADDPLMVGCGRGSGVGGYGSGMRFGVLGPLTVRSGEGGRSVVRVPEAKVRALLAVLLTHEGRPVRPDRLVDDLWGAEPPGKPANALQGKVSQLRRAIGRDRVVLGPAGYALDLTGAEVDTDRFRELLVRAGAAATARTRVDLLDEALGLWRGAAYADFRDESFVRTAVRRLEEQRLTALEDQAKARLDLGEHTQVAGELTALATRHPLRERLRLLQMRALYRAGRQGEALESYAELRALLVAELGADPGPEVSALHTAILRQDPSLNASVPPVPPVPLAPPLPSTAPLPTPLTSLVGRDDAVHEVGRLLSTARLVTLTGAGGVGKTRLALAAAGRLADTCASEFPDGVRLVELAGTPGDDVAGAVAAALGLRDDAAAATSADDRVAAALRERRTLLVLDNCEHIVEPVARLAERLLRTSPACAYSRPARNRSRCPARRFSPSSRSNRPTRSGCSRNVRPPPTPASPWTRRPKTPSRRSAAASTASRSRWNWPPPAYAHSASTRWRPGWTTASAFSRRAAVARPRGSRPCGL